MTTTTDTPPSPCPHCGAVLDRSEGRSGKIPRPGDVTICVVCVRPLTFDVQMQLQRLDWTKLDAVFRRRLKSMLRSMRAQAAAVKG